MQFLFCPLLQNAANAAENTEQLLNSYIDEYGKNNLVELILDIRASQITIFRNGRFKDHYGRPNKDFISAATLARDLKTVGMDVETFSKRLEEFMNKESRKHSTSNNQTEKEDLATARGYGKKGKTITDPHEYLILESRCKNDCGKVYRSCKRQPPKTKERCKQSSSTNKNCDQLYAQGMKKCNEELRYCENQCEADLQTRYKPDLTFGKQQ